LKRSKISAFLLTHGSGKRALETSSALNQVNNQDDDGNYEQEMNQAAANVADEAKKPENDQDDNYSPEHGYSFRLS
jgi:hypothetical protein